MESCNNNSSVAHNGLSFSGHISTYDTALAGSSAWDPVLPNVIEDGPFNLQDGQIQNRFLL